MGLSLAKTGRIKYLKSWSTVTPIFQNVDLFNLKYFIKYIPFKSKMKEKYAKLVCHIWIFRQFSKKKKKKNHFSFMYILMHEKFSEVFLYMNMKVNNEWIVVTFKFVLSERSRWPVSRAPIKLLLAIGLTSGGCEANVL